MSSEYPDVLGDLVETRQRFEVNGMHYVMTLNPMNLAPGATTNLRVLLQSCWDVPLQAAIVIQLPAQPPGAFSIIQKRTDVPLEPAEVGEVTIPIACATTTEPREYAVSVTIGAKPETRGLFIRSKEGEGELGETLLSFTTGMALATTVGLGFVARTQGEQRFLLRVEGQPQTGLAPNLIPTYLSHWTVADLTIHGKARQHINDQRLYLLPKLTSQALYMAFLEESQARFKEAGLPLQIGEALYLSKILTYTIEYFLKRTGGQDAILIPAFTLAFRYDLSTNDPVSLVVRGDYGRLVRLAISLSFGLVHQQLKRKVWTLEEQLAVAELVVDRVERGGVLPAEFLYLPLLLGGLLVAEQVQMPGEKLAQSLDLLTKAYRQRSAELAENTDLLQMVNQLVERARSAA